MIKQIIDDKEISTLKETIKPKIFKQNLKEEEIKFVRNLIKQEEENKAETEDEEPQETEEPVKSEAGKPVIEDVKIIKIDKLWKKKPKSLGLESDAIIVTVKTPDNRKVKGMFYAYIKPNGMFDIKSGRTGTHVQQRFINFLQNYKLADKLDGYNVLEGMKDWQGKTVELDENDKIVVSKEA